MVTRSGKEWEWKRNGNWRGKRVTAEHPVVGRKRQENREEVKKINKNKVVGMEATGAGVVSL